MEVHSLHPSTTKLPTANLPMSELRGPAPQLPASEQRRLRLPPELTAPGAARNLVTEACQAWRMSALLHAGRAVVSELVANAVEHARTDLVVTVARRGTALHLTVRDGCPALPRPLALAAPIPDRPLDERGHGLRLVEADSIAWGAVPTADGKVVWAVVRSRDGRPRAW